MIKSIKLITNNYKLRKINVNYNITNIKKHFTLQPSRFAACPGVRRGSDLRRLRRINDLIQIMYLKHVMQSECSTKNSDLTIKTNLKKR